MRKAFSYTLAMGCKCIIHIVGELSFIGFDTPGLTTIGSEAKTGLRIR